MKKTVQNLFTLVIAVLLIINTLPSMVYADEEIPAEDPSQAQVEVISETGNEQTPSDTQQENLTPVQEEKKEESPVNEVKEEVQIKIEEIATEQKEVKEEKAEQIVEIKAAEKTENNEAAASLNAAKAVEEKVEEKVEVVIPERIKITYNFNNIIKTDGSRISKNASSTLSVGSGWNITQKKLDNQIPAKNFEVNGDKYVYTGNWIYDDGTPVSTPISFKNTGYAEDQVINLSPVYEITRKVQEETIPAETKPAETKPTETKEAETKPVEAAQQKAEEIAPAIVEEAPKPDKFTVVINISGIWKSNGTQSSTVVNKTISKGTSSSMALKFFENKLGGYTTVRSNGYTYTYTGQWADENGNILSFPIVCKYADMTQDMEMNIHPIYEVSAPPASLKMNRIDRVSTCGSSWSGQLTGTEWAAHTFRTPDGQTHYQFLYWQDAETGTIYNPGDQLKITAEEIGAGNSMIVNIYTIWQPSVTIRYYDQKGRYLSEKEAFENLDVYDYLPNETAGLKFLGWSEAKNGEVLADNTVYEIPALTSDKVSQKIHNVYAVYSTEYQVEHSLEELDGSYRMEEKENKEAILGSKVEAEENEYEGFAFNEDVIGSVLEGTADPSLVLKLFYNRKSYNVSYQYVNAPENASALPETKSYKYMQPVKVADAASAEGYTFSGWNKENFNMPSGDVVISGSFDINSYKVTYRYENAPENAPALPAEAFYNYKENVEIAAAPQLKGYTFSGWNKENITMPASDVVISGSFKANSHTVRYELEGDVPANAPALPIAREYSYGEAVTIADDLKLEGYTFSGWDKENFTMDDEDVVIKGSFEINSYKVNYEYENAPENAPALPAEAFYNYKENVEIAAAPQLKGYTFSGWNKENITMPASDVVISGSFKANSHTVRYELEGDVPANAPALPIAREYSYGEAVTIADDLKLEGYTFSGWDKENFTMDDEDVVIKGSFEINSYKVNYEYENAPENAPALPETKEVKFNSKVEIAAAPTMEGYTFSGWDKEDFTMPASDVTIKGSFKVNSYTVSYEYENAPENAPELPAAAAYDYKQNVQIAAAPTIEGYTFSGWDKEDFTMPASDVTIKGSWIVNSHMVSYEVEGEFPADALVLPESREYKYGEEVKVAEALELEGYTFSGWDKEDFAMIDEDVIIKGSFEITWKNYDGSTLELDEAVEFGTMPSYDGNTPIRKADASFTYTFKGWTPVIEKVTGDKEYMAEYEAQAIIIPADDTPVKTEPANPVTPSTTNDPRLPEEPEIEIAEAPTPLAEAVNEDIAVAEIEDAMVPQAEMKSWALYNLIAAIISVITALAMVLSFFRKKEENEEKENADFNEAQIEMIENEEEEEEENDKRKKSKFLGLIPALLSVIIFIFTEDMRNPMVLKDRYTLLMVIIALATILLAFLSRNKKEEKEEEEREELEFVNVQLSE